MEAVEITVIGWRLFHFPMFCPSTPISKEDDGVFVITFLMATTELLRTFLAIYRANSLTDAAWHRGISQPAVSQHLAALERQIGTRLFVRGPSGVTPTQRARELYSQVTEPLDALEEVLCSLGRKESEALAPPLRFGSSPEYFSTEILPLVAQDGLSVTAIFESDEELLKLVDRGEIDLAVTSTRPSLRSFRSLEIGSKSFTLVIAPRVAPNPPLRSLEELAEWLPGQPWASYSLELPITRRFWHTVLNQPFSSRPHLVAPDLRTVVRAVELGIGASLLPTFVCAEPLAERRVVEPFPVAHLVEKEPWFACMRLGESRRSVAAVVAALGALAARKEDSPQS